MFATPLLLSPYGRLGGFRWKKNIADLNRDTLVTLSILTMLVRDTLDNNFNPQHTYNVGQRHIRQ